MFLLVKEAEGTGSDSQGVPPGQGSPGAEDGPVSVRPPTIEERTQPPRDKRGHPDPQSHMGD